MPICNSQHCGMAKQLNVFGSMMMTPIMIVIITMKCTMKMHAQKMRLQRMNYFLRLWQNHSLFFSRPRNFAISLFMCALIKDSVELLLVYQIIARGIPLQGNCVEKKKLQSHDARSVFFLVRRWRGNGLASVFVNFARVGFEPAVICDKGF